MWNNLDESLKTKLTISSFQHNLQTTTFQKYKYLATFEIGKRHLLVLEINNDPYNNRLRDNPLCKCDNETEEGEHYFFPIWESPPKFENQIMALMYVRSITRSTMYQKSSILLAGTGICLFVCFVALRPKSTAMVMAGGQFT